MSLNLQLVTVIFNKNGHVNFFLSLLGNRIDKHDEKWKAY